MQQYTHGLARGKSAAEVTRPEGQASCSICDRWTGLQLIGNERTTANFRRRSGFHPIW
jgi:hypothetical protein